MKYLFVGYPKCSTCKSAQKFLDVNNIQYDFRNIVVDNPNYGELEQWINTSKKMLTNFLTILVIYIKQ